MSRAADFIKIWGLRGGPRIFLRREYDNLGKRLSKLAKFYRRHWLKQTRIVAVVGSLGKTTTRRALMTALDCPNRNFSYSNYGSSLAENLLRIQRRDPHAVLEAGISRPGQMGHYAAMIRPEIVVVTSIKSEHNRSFPSLLDTRAEKVKMLRDLPESGLAVLNGDDSNVRWMATQTKARVITFGFNSDNDVRAENLELTEAGLARFDVHLHGQTFPVTSHLLGEHMVYPVLAALTVAAVEKVDLSGALARLARLEPEISRMELIALPKDVRILDDSFKSAFESVQAACETFAQIPAKRKIVVFGNIEEPTGKARDQYRELGGQLAKFADFIFCIGSKSLQSVRAQAVRDGMNPANIKFFGSHVEGVAEALQAIFQPGDLVLLKGSSTQAMRRITLKLMGRAVTCGVKYCDVKVKSCDFCPLLNAPQSWFKNYYVRRSTEF